jgi:hypothetical protein
VAKIFDNPACQRSAMSYVITCGDEGVQLNEGTRLGVVGAGFRLEGFSEVVEVLKKVFDKKIAIVSSEENDWVKQTLNVNEWDQADASMQQQVEALADREKLTYAGHLTFTDPRELKDGIKGHMVRPHGVHVANKICFTLGGGEQKYNLGCYLISADWVAEAKPSLVKKFIGAQVEFYKKISKRELEFVFEEGGELGESVAKKNRKALDKALAQ